MIDFADLTPDELDALVNDCDDPAAIAAIAAYIDRDGLGRTPWAPITPTRKQHEFLDHNEREVFYGGAAAGGKTSGILAAALQHVDTPGYAALLLRRNYKQLDLPGSWIPLSHQWLDNTAAVWHQGRHEWRFPSGATLTFGFVSQAEDDRRKYESAAFQFIGIDELTNWNEDDYRFLFSRLRRPKGMNVPIRMRSASNPGGRLGHEWVKRRFVDSATREAGTVFIRARIEDNPHIDREDYIESLREMHPTYWRRLLYGDWETADPGELFQPRLWLDDDDWLDDAPKLGVALRVRYWDLAASAPTAGNPDPDWTAGARFSRLTSGAYVLEHMVRARVSPAQTEQVWRSTALSDPRGTTQVVEQAPGAGAALMDHWRRNVVPDGVTFKTDPVKGTKGMRARPLAAAMENHRVKIVRAPWNEALFDEMEAFSEDPQHSGPHDDQVDACAGAFNRVYRRLAKAGILTSAGGAVPR